MIINFVCEFCNSTARDEATLEIDFKEKKMFFKCPGCKKTNVIDFSTKEPPKPLPRSRTVR